MLLERTVAASTPNYRFLRLWQALGWVMVLAIIAGSLLPPETVEPILPEWNDKLIHGSAYTSVAFWFAMLDRGPRRQALWALGFALMGVAIEFLQRATGYRDFEVADMATNAIGVTLGWGFARTPLVGLLEWVERLFGGRDGARR